MSNRESVISFLIIFERLHELNYKIVGWNENIIKIGYPDGRQKEFNTVDVWDVLTRILDQDDNIKKYSRF